MQVIDTLQNTVCKRRKGKEQNAYASELQHISAERIRVAEQKHKNRSGQRRHADCTGESDNHIEFDGGSHLVFDGIEATAQIIGNQSRNNRCSERRSHGNRNIGKQSVFVCINTHHGGARRINHTVVAHDPVEKDIIERSGYLVYGL